MPRVIPGVLVALVLGACGGSSAASSTITLPTTTTTTVATTTTTVTTTTTLPTTTTTEAGPRSPLTGLVVDRPELLDRRVLAVKIDNHPNARPQSGLERADAVYELLVEGGLTRFISLWHHSDDDYVGPMRSGRPTDPTLLEPLGATFTISGAQAWVISRIRAAGVPLIGEVRPATFRISSRPAPHNLYVDTSLLREGADGRGYPDDPPPALWEFGPMPDDAPAATEITMDFSPAILATWTWDGERYERMTNGVPHEWLAEDGTTGVLTTDTLVVLFVDTYFATPPPGVKGKGVPASRTVGSGRALVFAAGKVRQGTWSRDHDDEPFVLTDPDGNVLPVPPGRPWISLVPEDRGVSW